MKHPMIWMAGCLLLATSAGAAAAACRDEIARLSPGTTSGSATETTGSVSNGRVSKDGTRAPLETGNAASGQHAAAADTAGHQSSQGAQGLAKDGSTMPLANKPGGQDTTRALSQQDVNAQQHGQQAAAAAGQADRANSGQAGYRSPEMMAALDKARTMDQQGNESGCMQALEQAKRLQR